MFDIFNEILTPEMIDEIELIKKQIQQKQIPESYPEHMLKGFNSSSLRQQIIKQMGFALISNDWIKPLSKWIGNRKCLEVMAGSGALSFALKQQGINIISTDNYSWDSPSWWNNSNMWTNIENIDAVEAVSKYGKNIDIIVMAWAYIGQYSLQSIRRYETN